MFYFNSLIDGDEQDTPTVPPTPESPLKASPEPNTAPAHREPQPDRSPPQDTESTPRPPIPKDN